MRKGSLLLLAVVAAFLFSALSAAVQGQRGSQQVQLPDGNGKELVSVACARCHGLNLIANSFGYTPEQWT